MILPYGVNVEVRIVALACCNCLLFSGTNVCQLITHNVTIRTLKTTGDDELNFLHCYQLPKKASCASRTKSITSSVALTSKRSQNQSTAISDDAIVSNMKSCRSCSVCGLERSVFVMCIQYTILDPVPILCDT